MSPLDALRPLPSPPPNMTTGVGGWLTGNEEAALYALGRTVKGRILEVGPWIGRSTICIASGIRDSGIPKEFTTCELAPTEDHWRLRPDGGRDFHPDPDSDPLGGVSAEEWDMVVGPVITAPGGVVGVLYDNLVQARVVDLENREALDMEFVDELVIDGLFLGVKAS